MNLYQLYKLVRFRVKRYYCGMSSQLSFAIFDMKICMEIGKGLTENVDKIF